MAQRQHTEDRFYTAGSAQCVPDRPFGRAASCGIAEDREHGPPLHQVIAACSGAVQVDVVDRFRREPCAGECMFHRHPRSHPFGMRRRHVIGIARLADAQQQDCVRR